MDPVQIIVTILVGALIGWIASKIMKSKGGFLRNIIIGLLGGVIGGIAGGYINVAGGWLFSILLSIAGSCLLIWVGSKLFK